MGLTLPGGFSPWQAIQEVGDRINPFDASTGRDRDIFSNLGSQRNGVQQPQVQGVSTALPGAMHFDPSTGTRSVYDGDQWQAITPGSGAYGTPTRSTPGRSTGPTAAQRQAAKQAAEEKRRRDAKIAENAAIFKTIKETAGESAERGAAEQELSLSQYLRGAEQSQSALDRQAARNELARMRGFEGIQDFVGTGIKSTGAQLAQRNAGDSSAAAAIAQAYGQLGSRQASELGSEAALAAEDLAQQQEDLELQNLSFRERFELDRDNFIKDVVRDAKSKIQDLNAQIANADLPGQIALDQEIKKIKQQATGLLSAQDARLRSGLAGIRGASRGERVAEAGRLRDLGTDLGEDAFEFTTAAPGGFQGQAPAGGNLPIFTTPRRREETPLAVSQVQRRRRQA